MRPPCWFNSCHNVAIVLVQDNETGRLIAMCREHLREFVGESGGCSHAL